MEAYYYQQMNKQHQGIYQAMKKGILNLEDMILVPRTEVRELSDIFFKLRLDHPEIFWAVTFGCRAYQDSANIQILPEYLFEKGKIREHQKAMTARVEKLSRAAKGMNEWEKEKYIHDFICENVHYDKLKKPYSHEIIGALGHGVAVCEGIAKSVKVLCDSLGIPCIIAISEANPEKKIKYRHAWNLLKLGGTWYHLDATFDNSLSYEGIRYDYYNLPDKSIFRDHEPVITQVPKCEDAEHFYYKEKKLSFTKMEEVEKRAKQAAKKGKPLVFHWRGGYMTKAIVEEMLDIFSKCGKEREKYPRVSLNWAQAVLSVHFETRQVEEALILEEANEGDYGSSAGNYRRKKNICEHDLGYGR